MERKAQIILFSCKNVGNISEMVPPLWLCQQKHCIIFCEAGPRIFWTDSLEKDFRLPSHNSEENKPCKIFANMSGGSTAVFVLPPPPPPGPGSTPDRKDRPDIDLVRYSRISGWYENKMLELFYYHVSGQSCPASGHIPDMKKAGPSQPDGMKRVTN